jgi:dolichyl-phosphate-mannose--protein O-mannosyl transferase
LGDIVIRFLVGGVFVSVFALIGSVLKPKSLAGLFGAAPSVALATLALTISKDGKTYAATEARSMVAGAAALLVYCALVILLLRRTRCRTLAATLFAVVVWFGVTFAIWGGLLK